MKLELNYEQEQMVQSKGNLLVIACPGSGKTRAMIGKICRELELIENKQYIAAITFTNRASEEIQKRINEIDIETSNLWTGTIHSFCMEWILKPYSNYIDRLKYGFILIDEFKQSEIRDSLENKYLLRETVWIRWFEQVQTRSQHELKHSMFKEYNEILLQNKWIDFELVLYLSHQLLTNNRQIAHTLSKLFKLICIDEYQDISDLQYAILSSIIKSRNGKTNVILVGDPDQAIYETLGGVAKDIKEIREEFSGLNIEQLEFTGNYRSTQKIIDFYKNFQTNEKEIIARSNNQVSKVYLDKSIDESVLADKIATIVTSELKRGVPENEICILAPRWSLLISIARKLQNLLPTVNLDAPSLSPLPKSYNNFWYNLSKLFLTKPSPKLFLSRRKIAEDIIFELKTISGIEELYIKSTPLTAKSLLKFSNIMFNKFNDNEIDGIEYLEKCCASFNKIISVNLSSYSLLINQYNFFFNGIRSRLQQSGFVGESQKLHSYKNAFKENEGIVINTCQGVKGEEYETVIAFGLLNGFIPHASITDSQKAISSSNKLMYVIGSRAKTNLYLIPEIRLNRDINPELKKVIFEYDDLDI